MIFEVDRGISWEEAVAARDAAQEAAAEGGAKVAAGGGVERTHPPCLLCTENPACNVPGGAWG